MALNGDALGLALKAAVDGVSDKTDRDAIFKAMGNAIVTYIQANATVTVAGVTVGAAVVITTPPAGGIT